MTRAVIRTAVFAVVALSALGAGWRVVRRLRGRQG